MSLPRPPRTAAVAVLLVALLAGPGFAPGPAPAAAAPAVPTWATPTSAPYWHGWDIAKDIAFLPDGSGGYVLDGFGGVHAFGLGGRPSPPAPVGGPYWFGWDVARGLALLPNGSGGYVVDAFGGMHPFAIGGNALPPRAAGGPYWSGWDIARDAVVLPGGTSGYVLDAWGGTHPFGVGGAPAPEPLYGAPYWPGQPVARSIALAPNGGVVVMDGQGQTYDAAVGASGFPGRLPDSVRWGGWDITRGLTSFPDGSWVVLDGWGGIHRLGSQTTAATTYAFMGVNANGSAIRYDACTPLHYVINPSGAPGGAIDLVHQAIQTISQRTGNSFVFDGYTSELVAISRGLKNVPLYGNRPAPVLVGWSNPSLISALAGGVAGLGGSAATSLGGQIWWGTGIVILDGPQLSALPANFGPGITQGDIVLHELLHVVGLAHTNDSSQVMFPSATSGSAVLGRGDLAGLRRVGASAGCPASAAAAAGELEPGTVLDGVDVNGEPLEVGQWVVSGSAVETDPRTGAPVLADFGCRLG